MPKTPAALVTADCHLADYAWADRPTLRGDAYWAFTQICAQAIERRIPAIVVAGDLLDKRQNNSNVVAFLAEHTDRLKRAGTTLLFIQGDHDWQTLPWAKASNKNAVHLHGGRYGVQMDISFAGIDYQPTEEAFRDALEGLCLMELDILVIHQKLEDFLGGLGACNGALGMIPHARLVIAGDYHKTEFFETIGASGQKLVCLSPGSTCMQSIDEAPHKLCHLMSEDRTFSPISLRSRQVLRYPLLESPNDLDQMVKGLPRALESAWDRAASDCLPDDIRKPILYVPFLSELADAYRRIQRAAKDRAHLFVKIQHPDPVDRPESQRVRQEVLEQGLQGCLRLAVPDTKSELYQAAMRLLAASEPQKELQTMWSEHLNG